MVAATQTKSQKRGRIQGKRQGKKPKVTLSVRVSQWLNQELDNHWSSLSTDCSKSEAVEALLTKALASPKWIQVEFYEQLPAEKRSYVIFDRFNAKVEMGEADNLHQYVSSHPKLERFIADKHRIIYFS
jgi:hypothetical protein